MFNVVISPKFPLSTAFFFQILLILTDGEQTREEGINVDLTESTRKLIRKGVEVFVLGVGEYVSIPDMLKIAADKDGNIFHSADFDELGQVVQDLVSSFCKGEKNNIKNAFTGNFSS